MRLGIQSIDFHAADEEDDETHVPLAFHKRSIFETEVSPVGDRPEYLQGESGILGADLDEDDGMPRAVVPTWADPDVPPWADGEVDRHNVPTGYVAGEEVAVTVTLGEFAVSEARSIRVDALGPTPDEAPAVHLLLDGERVSDDPVTPGETVVVMLDAASSTMGKETRILTWSFEAETDGAWHTLSGAIETTHTIYTLAGPPALLDGTDVGKAPAIPWIGVLEDTSEIMEGVDATDHDVLDALRDYLFEHDYIVYDPSVGDYTDFDGPYIYWDTITAQISAFLDRRSGLSLYCHSMVHTECPRRKPRRLRGAARARRQL